MHWASLHTNICIHVWLFRVYFWMFTDSTDINFLKTLNSHCQLAFQLSCANSLFLSIMGECLSNASLPTLRLSLQNLCYFNTWKILAIEFTFTWLVGRLIIFLYVHICHFPYMNYLLISFANFCFGIGVIFLSMCEHTL